jgi:hypothetical protein
MTTMARKRFDPSQLGPIGQDIDLDVEEVHTEDSRRLTEKLAQHVAEEAMARHRGRPSVTGRQERTPNLTVRVAAETRDALEAIAHAQGRRLADVSRDALDEYVQRHPPKKPPRARGAS